MTLVELIAEVRRATGASEPEIITAVRANWPGHFSYTPTQARLLADLLNRRANNTTPTQVKPFTSPGNGILSERPTLEKERNHANDQSSKRRPVENARPV